jgi:Ca-activated chloride channel family protein
MGRDDFAVFEDNERQELQVFTAASIPISLGLLLDGSTSMKGQRIADAVEAFKQFVRNGLAPGDEAFVMAFAGVPVLVQGWTEKAELDHTMLNVEVGGGTPMYETLVRAVGFLSGARQVRQVLLLITDGNATDERPRFQRVGPSDVTRAQPSGTGASLPDAEPRWPEWARSALQRSEALLYAIGIDSPPADPHGEAGRPVNKEALRHLTDDTGGYTEIVASSADLPASVKRISDELKQQYLLGYSSTRARDGKYHRLRVEARCADCRVRARQGFQADKKRSK